MSTPSAMRKTLPKLVLHRRFPEDQAAVIHPATTFAGVAQETRIARALYEEWADDDAVSWDDLPGSGRKVWRTYARIALNSMAGPR